MIQMETQRTSEYAPPSSNRSDQTATNFHLNATGAQQMQSQAPLEQFCEKRRSFGHMPPPFPSRPQLASPNGPHLVQLQGRAPAEHPQYRYHANVQANQFVSTAAGGAQQQPLAQGACYQKYEPMEQPQFRYSKDAVNYLVQPAQHDQHQQQLQGQWPSASPPLFYPVDSQPQYCSEPIQMAPQDCSPCGACQPGSPMSTQSLSPAAATSILQTPMTPPTGGGQPGASGSTSSGRMASPSGASSTISSSESVGNVSINLEQYISKRNERERSRVRNVNDAFENLKNSLPLEMDKLSKRMSKVEILRTAISYIKNLGDVLDSKQQQARDDRALLQLQQQLELQQRQQQHCAAGPTNSMIRKRARSGSVGHLMRSSLSQQRHLLERSFDCENSLRLAWRHDRPGSSLSRHDLLALDDGFVPSAAYLRQKLDLNERAGHQKKGQQQRAVMLHEVPTNCRQDTFRQEQALVQNFRRRQEQEQYIQYGHQADHEMSAPSEQPPCGFDEFSRNVCCYNERSFDNY